MKTNIEEREAKTYELFKEIKEKRERNENSDKEFNELIDLNKGLIYKIINRYSLCLDEEEKFNIGVWGVSESINSFDQNRGRKLSSYIAQWIRIKLLQENRFDMVEYQMYKKESNARKELDKKGIQDPSYKEIADEIGISEKLYKDYQDTINYASFDKMISDDTSILDMMKDENTPTPLEEYLNKELLVTFDEIINEMIKNPKRDASIERTIYILKSHILEGKTFKDIGADLGVSKQRIQKVYASGLERVKKLAQKEKYSILEK